MVGATGKGTMNVNAFWIGERMTSCHHGLIQLKWWFAEAPSELVRTPFEPFLVLMLLKETSTVPGDLQDVLTYPFKMYDDRMIIDISQNFCWASRRFHLDASCRPSIRSFDFQWITQHRGEPICQTDKRTPVFPGAISRILVQQTILGLQADKPTKLQHLIFSPLPYTQPMWPPSRWCEFIGLKKTATDLSLFVYHPVWTVVKKWYCLNRVMKWYFDGKCPEVPNLNWSENSTDSRPWQWEKSENVMAMWKCVILFS